MATCRGCWTNDKRTQSYQENSGLLILKRGSWITSQSPARPLLLENKYHLGAQLPHPICIASIKCPKSIQSGFETASKLGLCFSVYIFYCTGSKDHCFLTATPHPYLDVISASFSASILPSSRYNTVLISLKTSRNSHPALKVTDLTFPCSRSRSAIFCAWVCACVCVYVYIYMHES